jgi:ABC-type iron transport system FetAB permease component
MLILTGFILLVWFTTNDHWMVLCLVLTKISIPWWCNQERRKRTGKQAAAWSCVILGAT